MGNHFLPSSKWCHLLLKYPRIILEHERMEIIIQNLTTDMSYRLQLHCPSNFKNIIEICVNIEEVTVRKGELKLYTKDNARSSN